MSDPTRLSLVNFRQTGATDVVGKLRRELQRVESADDPDAARDHVINAFWTAWHVHRWMWDTISGKPDLKHTVLKYRGIEARNIDGHEPFGAILASRFVPLKICRMIATSSCYVEVLSADGAGTLTSSKLDTSINHAGSTPVVIVMGRRIAATRLLIEIDDYWMTMIVDCGLE